MNITTQAQKEEKDDKIIADANVAKEDFIKADALMQLYLQFLWLCYFS